MANQQQAAQDLKHDYMSRIMEALDTAGPAIGAGVSGVGAAAITDKIINTDEDHAKDLINITTNNYKSNRDLGQAAAYIYGDTRTMSPFAQKQIGDLLMGDDPKGMSASILKMDHPDVYSRLKQVVETRPDLAYNLGINERLVNEAYVQAIDGNPESGVQMMHDSQGSNSALPIAASLVAGAGGAAALASMRPFKRS